MENSRSLSPELSTQLASSSNRNLNERPTEVERKEPGLKKHSSKVPTPNAFLTFITSKSLVLENKGLVARDHMANERTFLAWTRTSFVVLSLGIAFLQLYSIQMRATEAILDGISFQLVKDGRVTAMEHIGRPLGMICALSSIILMIFGYWRYMAVQKGLTHDIFPATRIMALVVTLVALVILALILVIDIKSQ